MWIFVKIPNKCRNNIKEENGQKEEQRNSPHNQAQNNTMQCKKNPVKPTERHTDTKHRCFIKEEDK